MKDIDDAVDDLVGLSSHTESPLDPARVRDYLGLMVDLIKSDPETLRACGDDLVRTVVYHAYRFEPCYAHLADYCEGRLVGPITIESANEYFRAWDQAHAL